MIFNGNGSFLALSLDSGGVTTGPITVPFIMALGLGIASTVGGRRSKDNSFGLIALCSIGPIIVCLFLGIFMKEAPQIELNFDEYIIDSSNMVRQLLIKELKVLREVSISLGLIFIAFMVIEIIFIKLSKKKILQIVIGIIYTFIG